MAEDSIHNRGRREGATLLRALLATFKWRLALPGVFLVWESAFHIAQVRGGWWKFQSIRARSAHYPTAVACFFLVLAEPVRA